VSKADKILQQMQNNPLDWRIDSLKTVAKAYNIEWRQRGTSHVVFVRSDGRTLPVPAHRPIKPIYIKKFVDFVME
jgi:predicted RNA binding protein YcfA (HicA-like mRNA interferase family)